MLTFARQGYSQDFVLNFEAIIDRLQAGAPVRIVAGPDDICAPLCHAGDAAHCRSESVAHSDRAASTALHEVPELALIFGAEGGGVLDPAVVRDLRGRFASGAIRAACNGCEWAPLCTQIAADGFGTAQL